MVPFWRDASQAGEAASPQKPHQHGLGLVIELVAHGNFVGLVLPSDFFQESIALFPCMLLHRALRRHGFCLSGMNRQSIALGNALHKPGLFLVFTGS